jgi:hypothetical protein
LTGERRMRPTSTSYHQWRWQRNRSGNLLRKPPPTVETNRATSVSETQSVSVASGFGC